MCCSYKPLRPCTGHGEGEGEELVPKGVIGCDDVCANKALQVSIGGQVADAAATGPHLDRVERTNADQ